MDGSDKFCACCGLLIKGGDDVIKIEYGKMHFTAHPHAKVGNKEQVDWFHRRCDIAVLGKKESGD